MRQGILKIWLVDICITKNLKVSYLNKYVSRELNRFINNVRIYVGCPCTNNLRVSYLNKYVSRELNRIFLGCQCTKNLKVSYLSKYVSRKLNRFINNVRILLGCQCTMNLNSTRTGIRKARQRLQNVNIIYQLQNLNDGFQLNGKPTFVKNPQL